MKIIFATHLRSSNGANFKQLRKTRIDLVAAWQRVKDGARVAEFLLDVELGVGIVRVFQVPVAIDDLVSLDRVLDRSHFRLRRTGGSGRSGGIPGPGILPKDQGSHADKKKQKSSQQTRTCQHKHLTPVVDETPMIRLAEPWHDGDGLMPIATTQGAEERVSNQLQALI